jgi:ketosteroid isomerase-like protein
MMATTQQSSSNDDLRSALQTVFDKMARVYGAQDAAACAAMFTESASLYSPYAPPTHGRAAIEALHRIWTEEPSAKKFEILDFGGSDELAWALAQFSEGAATADGTSLIVFERGPEAGWLIRICSLNSTVR